MVNFFLRSDFDSPNFFFPVIFNSTNGKLIIAGEIHADGQSFGRIKFQGRNNNQNWRGLEFLATSGKITIFFKSNQTKWVLPLILLELISLDLTFRMWISQMQALVAQ